MLGGFRDPMHLDGYHTTLVRCPTMQHETHIPTNPYYARLLVAVLQRVEDRIGTSMTAFIQDGTMPWTSENWVYPIPAAAEERILRVVAGEVAVFLYCESMTAYRQSYNTTARTMTATTITHLPLTARESVEIDRVLDFFITGESVFFQG